MQSTKQRTAPNHEEGDMLIKSVKGMNDILPSESHQWLWLEAQLKSVLDSFGYNNIRTPIIEHTNLFKRAIGEVTDIVEKEMYSFTDSLNGDSLTLRPEGTASVMRAVLEHNLLYQNSQKLWYMGSMFRHERPQKGRYRQFHQLGVEAVGFADATIDAEIILLQHSLWQKLGLQDLTLEINCLGSASERAIYRQELINYFKQHEDCLNEEAKARLHTNPLRILDSKNPSQQEINANAPQLLNYLGTQSRQHYENWQYYLKGLGIAFRENPRLVRGLDYYNLSVFEWISPHLGAQSTISAGGRYDGLLDVLAQGNHQGQGQGYQARFHNGQAIGFAVGIERLMLALRAQNLLPSKPRQNVLVISLIGNNDNEQLAGSLTNNNTYNKLVHMHALQLTQQLRQQGIDGVAASFSGASLKSQLKRAVNDAFRVVIIIGHQEVQQATVVVKFMDEQRQEIYPITNAAKSIFDYLKAC